MAPKRALFLCWGEDDICKDVRKFIEDSGVLLSVRDIAKQPMTELEIQELVGHLEIGHFLNKLSDAYAKLKLDKERLSREELIKLMVEDHTLVRKPIVKSTRLLTVGPDKKKIAEMLQIGANGQAANNSGPDTREHNVKPRKAGRSA